MTVYYKESDFLKVKKQRRLVLMTFFIMLGVYLIISAGILTWYLILPYKSPTIVWVKAAQHSFSLIALVTLLMFMGIKFKRVNRAYRTGYNLIYALKDTSTGNFLEYDETLQDKDGVDFKSLVFIEWNKYKKDFFERKVLVFNEWDFPEIPLNSNVRYVTQGNVLYSYEILDDGEASQEEIR